LAPPSSPRAGPAAFLATRAYAVAGLPYGRATAPRLSSRSTRSTGRRRHETPDGQPVLGRPSAHRALGDHGRAAATVPLRLYAWDCHEGVGGSGLARGLTLPRSSQLVSSITAIVGRNVSIGWS
jgi:hypothetical protein